MTPDIPPPLHHSSGSQSTPDISFSPSSLALSCSLEVLQDLGSNNLQLLLTVLLFPLFRSNKHPLPAIFRELFRMALPFTSTLIVLLQKNTRLFLLFAAFFTILALFGRVKRQPQVWRSPEVEDVASKRRKAFAAAHIIFIDAYELILSLHVFRQTGPPRRADCLAPPPVCHIKMEASR